MEDYYLKGNMRAATYDLVNLYCGGFLKGDIEHYLNCLQNPTAAHVLELGCGTGRVSEKLAKSGVSVTGLDLSDGMLDLARSKARKLHATISRKLAYLQGDMCHFHLDKKFDLIISPYYAFNHLLTSEQRFLALKNISDHIKDDALAVIHTIPADRLSQTLCREQLLGADMTISLPKVRDQTFSLIIKTLEHEANYEHSITNFLYEFTVCSGSKQVVSKSQERLRYAWFSDEEIISHCRSLQLKIVSKRSSFIPGEEGSEDIWCISKAPISS